MNKVKALLPTMAVNIVEQGDCWVWARHIDIHGYGRTRLNGRSLLAHRLAYELTRGTIPAGFHVDHMCSNRACVNPAHLQAVTPSENAQNRRGPRKGNPTGVRGVRWRAKKRTYEVSVYANGKSNFGGCFEDLRDAERAAVALRAKLMTNSLSDARSPSNAPLIARVYRARESLSPGELASIPRSGCAVCGAAIDFDLVHPDEFSASLDHIVPIAAGGSHDVANLQWLHSICNKRKGSTAA